MIYIAWKFIMSKFIETSHEAISVENLKLGPLAFQCKCNPEPNKILRGTINASNNKKNLAASKMLAAPESSLASCELGVLERLAFS